MFLRRLAFLLFIKFGNSFAINTSNFTNATAPPCSAKVIGSVIPYLSVDCATAVSAIFYGYMDAIQFSNFNATVYSECQCWLAKTGQEFEWIAGVPADSCSPVKTGVSVQAYQSYCQDYMNALNETWCGEWVHSNSYANMRGEILLGYVDSKESCIAEFYSDSRCEDATMAHYIPEGDESYATCWCQFGDQFLVDSDQCCETIWMGDCERNIPVYINLSDSSSYEGENRSMYLMIIFVLGGALLIATLPYCLNWKCFGHIRNAPLDEFKIPTELQMYDNGKQTLSVNPSIRTTIYAQLPDRSSVLTPIGPTPPTSLKSAHFLQHEWDRSHDIMHLVTMSDSPSADSPTSRQAAASSAFPMSGAINQSTFFPGARPGRSTTVNYVTLESRELNEGGSAENPFYSPEVHVADTPEPEKIETDTATTPPKKPECAGSCIHSEDFEVHEMIGKGSIGKVHRGRWKGADVAIKKCHSKHFDNIVKEATLLSTIRPHPNIVALYGVCKDRGHEAFLVEYYDGGSVRSLIKQTDLCMKQKVHILQQAASGVEHLHSQEPPVIHRDLACRNLLCREKLSGCYCVAVCDFGFSRECQEDEQKSETRVGPARWMAPEAIVERKYSKKSDVWSFGALIFELLTQTIPYSEYNVMQVLVKVHNGTLILKPERGWPKLMKEILNGCLKYQPDLRLEMTEVRSMLEELEVQLAKSSEND